MRERLLYCFTWLSVFLLLPYLITCMINGAEAALLNRKFDAESCIPLLVALQIPDDYEEEAVKAQAVIARTNLYYELDHKNILEIIGEIKGESWENRNNFVDKVLNFFSYPHKMYQKAVLDTVDMVLTYDQEVKLAPYHPCSGGTTRNGEEAFRSAEYSDLKSVDSGFDKESADFIYVTYFSEEQLSGEVEIQERDQAGYVLSLSINGNILEGETFRQGMNLPSSNFSLQKTGEKYQVICRGEGYGVGFSQYGGNELAKAGKGWEDILQIYFPEMSIISCKLM